MGQSGLVINCSYFTVYDRSQLDVDITIASYIVVFKFKSISFFFFLLEQEIKGFGSYVRKFPESWYG